ncbi:MAG: Holliday junction branch migration protein RuvA [Bacteroidaceae bacterium]|nr:Holliday junction branch migration protein RuvA [Bacteroidaceae bacterium]
MIEYIKGKIEELTPMQAVVEAGGIGYQLFISLNTYSAIQGKTEAKLYVYEAIREDAHLLYGFKAKSEREIFLLLISVSGIGCQTARMILSAFSPAELSGIIQSEDLRSLKSIKGIGPKAAQRIIVELKDKVLSIDSSQQATSTATVDQSYPKTTVDEAVAALTMLGFPPAPTHKVVVQIVKADTTLPVEMVVKQALKMM